MIVPKSLNQNRKQKNSLNYIYSISFIFYSYIFIVDNIITDIIYNIQLVNSNKRFLFSKMKKDINIRQVKELKSSYHHILSLKGKY